MSNIIQGSPEWFALRLGKVTASRVADVVAKTKSGWGASRANYMAELIAERLTGEVAASYVNGAMQWGIEHEASARAAYEFRTDSEVTAVGFIIHPTIVDSGASPDGLVGGDGLIELKCPNTATHLDTLLALSIPEKYVTQMQWQMACAGRKWCDFVSFDPRMPESMRLFIRRVERDDEAVAKLEKLIVEFLDEMAQKIAGLIKIYEANKEAA
jgi:putative phage-type endonuclease